MVEEVLAGDGFFSKIGREYIVASEEAKTDENKFSPSQYSSFQE